MELYKIGLTDLLLTIIYEKYATVNLPTHPNRFLDQNQEWVIICCFNKEGPELTRKPQVLGQVWKSSHTSYC